MDQRRFREAVRVRLQEIPLQRRSAWSQRDLSWWWNDAKLSDTSLSVATPSIEWAIVKMACADMIGERAGQ
jgi:hypothetical protein